jgi:hypothetical protein
MHCKSPARDDIPVIDFGRLCGKKLIESADVIPLLEPAENFISMIEKLIF